MRKGWMITPDAVARRLATRLPLVFRVSDELATGKARDGTAFPDHSLRMQTRLGCHSGTYSQRSIHSRDKLVKEHRVLFVSLACGIYFHLLHFMLFVDRERSLQSQSNHSLYFPEKGSEVTVNPAHSKTTML